MSGWRGSIGQHGWLLAVWLAAAPAVASGGELQAAYEVSWAGIAVGRVETSLDGGAVDDAGYRLSWQGTTVGLAQSLFPFASAGSSEGRRVDGRILSGRFAGETRWSDGGSRWLVTFAADGHAGRIELAPDSRAAREPVPAALQLAPDPMALLLQAVESAAPGLRADGTSFDGKRVVRYTTSCDLEGAPADTAPPELLCTIEGRLLAGAAKDAAPERPAWRQAPIRAWLRQGLRPGGWWPVRIEVPAPIGTVAARLVELQGRPHIEG